MRARFAFAILPCFAAAPALAQTDVRAWHQDGQTFVVWDESALPADTYEIYRAATPVADTTLAKFVGRVFIGDERDRDRDRTVKGRRAGSALARASVVVTLSIVSSTPAASQSASRELQDLHDDDQKDQKSPEADSLTREFLLQHGREVSDYLLAHALASAAIFEDDAVAHGKFLCGATLDRYLVRLERPQCFGSQGQDPTKPGSPSNESLPLGDGIRREFGFGPDGAATGRGVSSGRSSFCSSPRSESPRPGSRRLPSSPNRATRTIS